MSKREHEHVSRFMREQKDIKRSYRKQWKEQKNNCRKKACMQYPDCGQSAKRNKWVKRGKK